MENLKMRYYKNKKIRISFIFIVLVVLIFNTLFVSSLSIGFGSAVNIEPGQSLEKSFLIMNNGQDSQDSIIEIKIEEGFDYVSFPEGTRYEVLAGTAVEAIAIFNVPNNAKSGDVYKVKIVFNTVEGGGSIGGGTIEFQVGQSISFDINVLDKVPTTTEFRKDSTEIPNYEKTERRSTGSILVVSILIIILIVLIIVLIAMRKNKEMEVSASVSVKRK